MNTIIGLATFKVKDYRNDYKYQFLIEKIKELKFEMVEIPTYSFNKDGEHLYFSKDDLEFNIEKENLYIKLNYKKRKNFLEVSVEGKELILLFYSEVDFKNDFRKNLENNTKNLIVFAKNICDDFACYFGK